MLWIGARAPLVHAIDARAAAFYSLIDLPPSPLSGWMLMPQPIEKQGESST